MADPVAEVDEFTAGVSVPTDVTDDADSASLLDNFVQALTNRTRYLYNRIAEILADAAGIGYTPAESGDWLPSEPDDVAEGLDDLAARSLSSLGDDDIIPESSQGLLWDADSFDDDATLTLTDLFFEGNTPSQSTEAQKPDIGTDARIRSLQILTFSQDDQNLALDAGFTLGAQDFDGLLLFAVDDWQADKDVLQMQNAGDTDYVILRTITGANRFQAYTANLALRPATIEGAGPGNGYVIVRLRRTTAGANVTLGITGENGTEQTATAAATAADLSKVWIGAAPGGGKTPRMRFKRAVFATGGQLSLAQRRAYTKKWNRECGLNKPLPAA